MRHFRHQKVSKQQSNAGTYQVRDLVSFNQVQITDIPPSLVHNAHNLHFSIINA